MIKKVMDRAWPAIEGHNEEARARFERAASQARLEAMDEPTRIIAQAFPGDMDRLSRLSKAERMDLAANIVRTQGDVVFVGRKGVDYNDRRELPPPPELARRREEATRKTAAEEKV